MNGPNMNVLGQSRRSSRFGFRAFWLYLLSEAQRQHIAATVNESLGDEIGFVLEFAVGMRFPTLTIVSVVVPLS
jgi:hypothetical protein